MSRTPNIVVNVYFYKFDITCLTLNGKKLVFIKTILVCLNSKKEPLCSLACVVCDGVGYFSCW